MNKAFAEPMDSLLQPTLESEKESSRAELIKFLAGADVETKRQYLREYARLYPKLTKSFGYLIWCNLNEIREGELAEPYGSLKTRQDREEKTGAKPSELSDCIVDPNYGMVLFPEDHLDAMSRYLEWGYNWEMKFGDDIMANRENPAAAIAECIKAIFHVSDLKLLRQELEKDEQFPLIGGVGMEMTFQGQFSFYADPAAENYYSTVYHVPGPLSCLLVYLMRIGCIQITDDGGIELKPFSDPNNLPAAIELFIADEPLSPFAPVEYWQDSYLKAIQLLINQAQNVQVTVDAGAPVDSFSFHYHESLEADVDVTIARLKLLAAKGLLEHAEGVVVHLQGAAGDVKEQGRLIRILEEAKKLKINILFENNHYKTISSETGKPVESYHTGPEFVDLLTSLLQARPDLEFGITLDPSHFHCVPGVTRDSSGNLRRTAQETLDEIKQVLNSPLGELIHVVHVSQNQGLKVDSHLKDLKEVDEYAVPNTAAIEVIKAKGGKVIVITEQSGRINSGDINNLLWPKTSQT